ncbi:cysteine protease StiP family protein [Photobacterium leiognathi]|uniref:cysteine protease StiP family protein n=1 Tax=Photobacterium leiognathi TaxID=553611 RepID=UPI001EE0B714|nr:cysteine protease StiP family protein [Photobacterium leiognathi]MCG3884461.1 cysteine protease StiP family protein [Photobacterium leiognathi]
MNKFSGSYSFNDVEFLLNPIEMKMTPVEEKETLIQSGAAHYSDMLSQEPEPSEEHLFIFNKATETGAQRLANEVLMLAKALSKEYVNKPVVLVSLVRAGVPLGVLIHRALKDIGHESYHYGVSIIRDRGIDDKAMRVIEERHGTDSIVFVDGWTGKGAITRQLTESLAERKGYPAKPNLVVLADPCGMAWLSASYEDWLIPFGILGAPVSGLVSRSVWSSEDYHGCVLCNHLEAYDCSEQFADKIHELQNNCDVINNSPLICNNEMNEELQQLSTNVINFLKERYQVDKINRIKPGIAEATRAVLRRVPDHVLVRNKDDQDVQLLVMLAERKGIVVEELGQALGQYRAATIIKKVL